MRQVPFHLAGANKREVGSAHTKNHTCKIHQLSLASKYSTMFPLIWAPKTSTWKSLDWEITRVWASRGIINGRPRPRHPISLARRRGRLPLSLRRLSHRKRFASKSSQNPFTYLRGWTRGTFWSWKTISCATSLTIYTSTSSSTQSWADLTSWESTRSLSSKMMLKLRIKETFKNWPTWSMKISRNFWRPSIRRSRPRIKSSTGRETKRANNRLQTLNLPSTRSIKSTFQVRSKDWEPKKRLKLWNRFLQN